MLLRHLLVEAVDGVTRRPVRSALTALGVMLGVGSFVTVLGLTATANSQIASTFSRAAATEVSVAHARSADVEAFPATAEQSLRRLNGVTGVGRLWTVDGADVSTLPTSASGERPLLQPRVTAASPGFWRVVRPRLAVGRVFDEALTNRPVAVVGSRLSERLGLRTATGFRALYVGDHRFSVVGEVSGSVRERAAAMSVVIPSGYAEQTFGVAATDELVLSTRLGAGHQVAREAPFAIDAYQASTFTAEYPPSATRVAAKVISRQLRGLFIDLAAVCTLIGAVGILNVIYLGVIERVPEIGLRRALGAARRHILYQFLLEALLLGFGGGLAGALVGEIVTITAAALHHWTPSLDARLYLLAAPSGALVGLVAGMLPAWRASRVEPVNAFKR